jgi:hypothetical protein
VNFPYIKEMVPAENVSLGAYLVMYLFKEGRIISVDVIWDMF